MARYASTEGVIGQIRFYEDHVPELLISESGTLVRMALKPNEVRAVQAYMPR